jgi:hypothetical protein
MALTAVTIDQLRNQILVSWYGRKDGMDANEFEIGPHDLRVATQVIATTLATTIANYGFTALACTVASSAAYTMQQPVQGVQKQIVQTSSSTLGYTITLPANVNFCSTPATAANSGSTYSVLTFAGAGQQVDLIGLTSSLVAVKAGGLAQGIGIV